MVVTRDFERGGEVLFCDFVVENPFFQPNRNRIMILGPVGHPFSSRRFRNIMSEPKLLFATYILLPFQIYELYDGHQRVI